MMMFRTCIWLCLWGIAGPLFAQKVVFVMSAADTLTLSEGRKMRQTGVFLNELYVALRAVRQAGYEVAFATPGGVPATTDLESLDPKYWKKHPEWREEAMRFVAQDSGFRRPMRLETLLADADAYAGLVIPGGQGLMVDLFYEPLIPQLLSHFGRAGKPVGLICHAPALLLTLPAGHPFEGFQVNAVSGAEEWFIERLIMKGRPANRKIGRQLRQKGFRYRSKRPAADYALRDRSLITSQNPFSGDSFNRLYLQALQQTAPRPMSKVP